VLGNIDALTIIIFIPILNVGLYPILQRHGIPFRPIARIAVGFIFAGAAMLYAAGVQHLIYTSVSNLKTKSSAVCDTNISRPATMLRFAPAL